MDTHWYRLLADTALDGGVLDDASYERVLSDPSVHLLRLLDAAFEVRSHHWGRRVRLHVLNNAANGRCPEDCSYCSQATSSDVEIEEYPMKGADEILAEAELAHRSGAFRYCLVMSGRGPSAARTREIASIVRQIKDSFPLEVCVSAGLIDDTKAGLLADAGLDRLNHNLNTAEERYGDICTTHTYQDRLATLGAARRNGIQTCSGLIAGMGEEPAELVEMAMTLRSLGTESIPVNFLLPFEGNSVGQPVRLSPDYCLRVLCLFRFVNPSAEIRVAAGREYHLRSMEAMSLYPANSIFLDGYLNAPGSPTERTLEMIRDAGFEIDADQSVGDLLAAPAVTEDAQPVTVRSKTRLKTLDELRPARTRG